MICPCGSGISFSSCCHAIIEGKSLAASPEQLMRSRYSAYATKKPAYIYNTYATSTQKSQSLDDIAQWAEHTRWCSLTINYASDYNAQDYSETHPSVDFTAFYFHENHFYRMRENSRFILEQGHWRYLDGEVTYSDELATPKRNEQCFCGSTRKFKQCCAV
jgi:SEC-C motif-containing protein